MVGDLIMRLMWTLTVAGLKVSSSQAINEFFITSLTFTEMFRRFVWNFFRLEHEHICNVAELKAVRRISLDPITSHEVRPQPVAEGKFNHILNRVKSFFGAGHSEENDNSNNSVNLNAILSGSSVHYNGGYEGNGDEENLVSVSIGQSSPATFATTNMDASMYESFSAERLRTNTLR